MTLIYVKKWEELLSLPSTRIEESDRLINIDSIGTYNKVVHGQYGGEYWQASIDSEGWAIIGSLYFPLWTYRLPGEERERVVGTPVEDFEDIYEAFDAWDSKIDRDRKDIEERIKLSFRKMNPRDYRDEN